MTHRNALLSAILFGSLLLSGCATTGSTPAAGSEPEAAAPAAEPAPSTPAAAPAAEPECD